MATFSGPKRRLPTWLAPYNTNLTRAEESILHGLIVDGKSMPELAEEYAIGIETVRSHARTLYTKLGVRGHTDLFVRIIHDLTKQRHRVKQPDVSATAVMVKGHARELVRMLHVAEPIGWECTVCNIREMHARKSIAIATRREHVSGSDHRRNSRRRRNAAPK